MSDDSKSPPVRVIESIPVGGDHEVTRGRDPRRGDSDAGAPAHLPGARARRHGAHPPGDRPQPAAPRRAEAPRQGARASSPFYRDGFIAEAQITGQLEHPNIVPVHELAVDEHGVPYFTMKLVQGVSFDKWLRDGVAGRSVRPSASKQGLEIFTKVCDAVAYAHHRGVIHRDLKPDNIMVAAFGQVYLMDWGLARLTKTRPASGELRADGGARPGRHARRTWRPSRRAATPRRWTSARDIFGLGAVLYEIVSGKTPYGASRRPRR